MSGPFDGGDLGILLAGSGDLFPDQPALFLIPDQAAFVADLEVLAYDGDIEAEFGALPVQGMKAIGNGGRTTLFVGIFILDQLFQSFSDDIFYLAGRTVKPPRYGGQDQIVFKVKSGFAVLCDHVCCAAADQYTVHTDGVLLSKLFLQLIKDILAVGFVMIYMCVRDIFVHRTESPFVLCG